MTIALGADHGGFLLKEAIKKYLNDNNIEFIDFGTNSEDSVDYPEYAIKVANAVLDKNCDYGILCCGTGIGISIAANKFPGIRAALCTNEFTAEMTRRHNDANILCLGGRVTPQEEALKLVKIFLETKFEGGRHKKRIEQIKEIEKSFYNNKAF